MADPIQPTVALIPAGEFLMGSEAGTPNERPVHAVYLDAFGLATTPVSNREYARFIAATGHPAPPFWTDPQFSAAGGPVVGASWYDAVAYCEWLSACTAMRYRLPTEAEREKAARGGREGALYPWGDALPDDRRGGRECPVGLVGQGQPNDYGLYNMADLVHEWCSDWSDREYYGRSPYRNPTGPADGKRRSARGGSWRHATRFTRCAARSSLPPDRQFSDFGFRCALSESCVCGDESAAA